MKNSNAEIKNRRNLLLAYIKKNQDVTVNHLIDVFNISPATLRRDLDYLNVNKYITRSYGRVRINELINSSTDNFLERSKISIAKYVASQINEFDTVFINTSSTAIQVLKYIKKKHVTIITNNANAIQIDHDSTVMVILTGGELRIPKYSMVGDFAINAINRVRANKCILGVNGISPSSGLTAKIAAEASINQLMVERCDGTVYVVCDHSKLGKDVAFSSASLEQIDYIITDKLADNDLIEQFEQKNIKVIKVEDDKLQD